LAVIELENCHYNDSDVIEKFTVLCKILVHCYSVADSSERGGSLPPLNHWMHLKTSANLAQNASFLHKIFKNSSGGALPLSQPLASTLPPPLIPNFWIHHCCY